MEKRSQDREEHSESYVLFASSENYSPKLDRTVEENGVAKQLRLPK